MKVAIRVDASRLIGSGHVMRCLALAEGLRKSGATVRFICREHEKKLTSMICNKQFDCEMLHSSNATNDRIPNWQEEDLPELAHWLGTDWSQDVVDTRRVLTKDKYDWLIVDHYALNWRWQSALRPFVGKIMVIDDLADRRHDCDVILDSVCGRQINDYRRLSPTGCQFLLGTKFALLRTEFSEWRNVALQKRQRTNKVRRFLITMGGVDMQNLTGTVLDQFIKINLPLDAEVNVVVGTGYSHVEQTKLQIKNMPTKSTLEIGVDDMARKITEADFGIGAFGISTWERCCLGLPSVNIVTEKNQRQNAGALKKENIGKVLCSESLDKELVPAINQVMESLQFYQQSVYRGSQLVDGDGVARVADCLENIM